MQSLSQFDQKLLEIDLPHGLLERLIGRLKYTRHLKQANDNEYPAKIAFPEARVSLMRELSKAKKIGSFGDGNEIYLLDYRLGSSVIKEIGRLREVSFRNVGEGTLKSRDVDRFDKFYRHIVLWDAKTLEIMGAYRIGEAFKLVEKFGQESLYSSRLFEYGEKFQSLFPNAIELGRSFIQPKYQGKRSLDYLWLGIGAYLAANPHVRYIFGAVSISNDYPDSAKQHIVNCYKSCFQPNDFASFAKPSMPFKSKQRFQKDYLGLDFKNAVKNLKANLADLDCTLPVLYRQYSDLCDQQGIRFIDFNIDPQFSYCVDGLMLADLDYIKRKKRARYIESHLD
ncbi:MAG: GNAT family N-acetyltransferase [Acidiferrobacterales bacterium]|nr:GNAT family N-acetyltransferase [Acidiferrobacterales bacterium]